MKKYARLLSFLLIGFFAASFASAQITGDSRWPGLNPTVPQPSYPALCASAVGSNGEPAGVLYALQAYGEFNESALDTTRLQNAINRCAPAPGLPAVGLELALNPSGTSCGNIACNAFLSAPLTLPAGLTLVIDPDVILYADSANSSTTPFISVGANTGPNVTQYTGGAMGYWGIMGLGTIDGQGSTWGFCGTTCGPRLINLGGDSSTSADYFTLYQVTLQHSGQIHFIGHGNDLLVYDAKISTPADTVNTDGVDPAGSTNVTIVNSFFNQGDDHIAFNAGASHVSNVTIAHNHLYAGHGISIGSSTTMGAENVLVTDVAIDDNGIFGSGSKNSLRIKSDSLNGGEVKNILYDRVCIQNGGHIIIFNPYYDAAAGTNYPNFHDITLQNVNVLNHDATLHNGASALEGYVNSDAGVDNPLNNVTLDNVVFNYTPAQFASEFYATATVGSEYGINYTSLILGPDPVSQNTLLDTLNGSDGITVTDNTGGGATPPYDCTGKFTYLAAELFAAGASGAPLTPAQVLPGGSFTLRAIVQPIVKPTYSSAVYAPPATSGTLTFYDNGTKLGTVAVNGQRITNYSISNVAAGTHVYTATYSGDSYYLPTSATSGIAAIGGAIGGQLPVAPTFPALTVQAMVPLLTPTITATNKTYDGTTTEPIANLTCTLTPAAQNVTCAAAAAAFASANAGTAIPVTATGIMLAGTAASNYSLSSTSATATANIAPANPTLTLTCTQVAEDGDAHSCTGTATGVAGAAVAGSFTLTPGSETAIGSYPETAIFTGSDPNYANGSASGTLVIVPPQQQVVNLNCPAVPYTGQAQTCTVTATPVAASCSGLTLETNAGSYPESVSCTPVDTTYTGGSAAAVLVINPATPSLTLTCPEAPYDGSPHFCTGTAIGVDGSAIAGSFSLSPASEVAAGNYPVTGTFASADPNYVSGGSAQGTLKLDLAVQSPTVICPGPITYDGNAHGCVIGGGFGVCGSAVVTNVPGSAALALGCTGDSNHSAWSGAGSIVINPAAPALTVICNPVTANGSPQACSPGGSSAGIGGVTVAGSWTYTYNGATPVPSLAGSYPVAGTFLSGDSNYSSGTASGLLVINPQPASRDWAWMGGSSTGNELGVYGTLGSPALANFPGSRESAVSRTDSSGNLWLFGGYGFDITGSTGYLNDLWKLIPSTREWVWMGGSATAGQSGVYGSPGVPATGNISGGREGAVSWTDNSGNLWLFGGYGLDSAGTAGYLNDLWKFNPATQKWAWMGGSNTVPSAGTGRPGVYGTPGTPAAGNIPGGRMLANTWTDGSGNLWLFGGTGYDSAGTWGYLNDLWEFNLSTQQWAWMSGSSTIPVSSTSRAGVYGTLGTAAAANVPGGRELAGSWTDAGGNLWLWGGLGYDSNSWFGHLNDLWEFNVSTSQWAWMGGSNSNGQQGAYGIPGVPAAGNVPGGRNTPAIWTDSSNNVWLFGGYGLDSSTTGVNYFLNDLWELNPSTLQWAWMAGSNLGTQPGIYGIPNVPAAGNTPGGREFSVNWIDSSGTLWLLGGLGANSTTASAALLNDLWAYLPSGSNVVATPVFSLASGSYASGQTVAIADATVGATIYYTTDGTAPATKSNLYTGAITVDSTETVSAIAVVGNAISPAAAATYTLSLPAAPTPTFSLASGVYPPTQMVTLSVAMNGAVIHYTTNGATPTAGSTTYNSAIKVSATETIKAIAVASGYDNSAIATATYTIGLAAPQQWTWMGGSPTGNQPGVYGTLGVSAAGNLPGGRYGTVSWSDNNGNFWLFGGDGFDTNSNWGRLNDLWEFSPLTGQWTWINGSNFDAPLGVYGTLGVPSVLNVPGGRYRATGWTDAQGNLWLFGGSGRDSAGTYSSLNDLWEYTPSTGLWTWVSGSNTVLGSDKGQPGVYGTPGVPAAGNVPGARESASVWVDGSGNFWLFGGYGYNSTGTEVSYNDLWQFNPSTKQWAWMGGSSSSNQGGVFGALGVFDPTYLPGARASAVNWTDSQGNFWLAGGSGYDSSDTSHYLNDVWEFNVSTNQWAWMGGRAAGGQKGAYGALGTPATANAPGGRQSAVAWTDSNGNICLFGGYGDAASGTSGDFYLNDVWQFSPATGEFTWMGGSTQGNQSGVYGALGAASTPGSREYAVSWTDRGGNLWLFGGYGYNSYGAVVYMNDLWEYQSPAVIVPAATPTFSVAPGAYPSAQKVTISDAAAGATIHYTTDGSLPSAASSVYTAAINITSTATLQAIATAGGYSPSAVAAATYAIVQTPTLTWAPPAAISYGTPLSGIQLNATASVPGTFAYNPPAGTVLNSGSQTLSVLFTPQDATDYTTATQTVTINVNPAAQSPVVSCPVR